MQKLDVSFCVKLLNLCAQLIIVVVCVCLCVFVQRSSSSESLSEKASSDLKKSFDAVVFDVLKVTPEEYAVSKSPCSCV